MRVTKPSRPYDKEKAAANLVGICLATVVSLATVIVIVAGIVAIIGGILSALGIFLAMPDGVTVPTIAAVFLLGTMLLIMMVFGM